MFLNIDRVLVTARLRAMNPRRLRERAFTLIELLVVIAIIAILAGMLIPALAKAKERAMLINDLNNIRQVLIASHSFANDNSDYLPNPGWDGVTRDCWAFAGGMPDALGNDTIAMLEKQRDFARRGQLGPYIGGAIQVFMCPKDVADSRKLKHAQWVKRSVKITSYVWNGAIISYASWSGAFSKYKLSDLRPTGILMWEAPEEEDAYLFNDTGNTPHEGVSQRHGGGRVAKNQADNVGGIATMGNLMGASYVIKRSRWFSPEYAGKNVWPSSPNPAGPNDAWYNPATANGQ